MGLFDKIKGEFIDIIEWLDPTQDTMVYRFERFQNEIKNGASLTVRESQVAVLVNEGQIADVYQPGRYTLTTQNMPIMTTLQNWPMGFNSPFKAEVYFFNTKQFTNMKWGTKNPIMVRDQEFGPVRLRAFGTFAMRIVDPTKFLKEIVGTDGEFSKDEVDEQLKSTIVTRFTDMVGEAKIPMLDLAGNLNELSNLASTNLADDFNEYGLKVTKFLVENISLPPEVEKALDQRSSMGIIGDMNKFAQFQMGNSFTTPGGGSNPAGDAMGMMMGMNMANQMMQQQNQQNMMNQQNMNQNQGGGNMMPPPPPGMVQYFVAVNGAQTGPFDMATLTNMIASGQLNAQSNVWKQGMAGWLPAGQVQELSQLWNAMPPPPPPVG